MRRPVPHTLACRVTSPAHPGLQSPPALLHSLRVAAPAACGGCVEDFGQQEGVLEGWVGVEGKRELVRLPSDAGCALLPVAPSMPAALSCQSVCCRLPQLCQHTLAMQLQALRSSALGTAQRTSPRRLPSASPSETAAMDTASTKLLHSLAVCPVPLPPPA